MIEGGFKSFVGAVNVKAGSTGQSSKNALSIVGARLLASPPPSPFRKPLQKRPSYGWRRQLESMHRQQCEADRADLHRAGQEAEREARRLRDAQAQINQDRADALREATQEAARIVLELFLGVLDGSVRPRPDDPRVWIIRDDGLRERAKKLDLIQLIKDTMKVLHDAWTKITEQLSPLEQEVVSEQIAEPVKVAFRQETGNQP